MLKRFEVRVGGGRASRGGCWEPSRPKHERPFILFPIGWAADDAVVPDLRRKSLDEVAVWNPRPREESPEDAGDEHGE